MDTLTSLQTTTTALEFVDLDTLREQLDEAREAKEEAWKAQSQTTVEEGYALEQAEAAANQALDAEASYRRLWHQYDSAKAAAINAVEDAEIDYSPMGGW
jgi:hypothetical protein